MADTIDRAVFKILIEDSNSAARSGPAPNTTNPTPPPSPPSGGGAPIPPPSDSVGESLPNVTIQTDSIDRFNDAIKKAVDSLTEAIEKIPKATGEIRRRPSGSKSGGGGGQGGEEDEPNPYAFRPIRRRTRKLLGDDHYQELLKDGFFGKLKDKELRDEFVEDLDEIEYQQAQQKKRDAKKAADDKKRAAEEKRREAEAKREEKRREIEEKRREAEEKRRASEGMNNAWSALGMISPTAARLGRIADQMLGGKITNWLMGAVGGVKPGIDVGRAGIDVGRAGIDVGRAGIDVGRAGIDVGGASIDAAGGAGGAARILSSIGSIIGPAAAIIGAKYLARYASGKITGTIDSAGDYSSKLAGNNISAAHDAMDFLAKKSWNLGLLWGMLGDTTASLGKNLDKVSGAFEQRAREISGYHGGLAASVAISDVRKQMADIREARYLGQGLSKVVDLRTDIGIALREALLPIKKELIEILLDGLRVAKKMADGIGNLVEATSKSFGGLSIGDVIEAVSSALGPVGPMTIHLIRRQLRKLEEEENAKAKEKAKEATDIFEGAAGRAREAKFDKPLQGIPAAVGGINLKEWKF